MTEDIDGIILNYEVLGTGKELVLLHGWGASIEGFRPVINYFSKFFKVITIDFPGFGKTPPPNQIWGVSDYGDFLNKFLLKIGVKNPILLGHSFGGRVIIYLAGKGKIKPKKIILVDSAGIKPKRKISYYIKVYTFKIIKRFLLLSIWKNKTEKLVQRARDKFGSSDYKNSEGIIKDIMVKVVNEDLRHYLPYISSPTLLIWGENDTATPLKDAKIMEKLIPDSGIVVLKDAGHFSYLDKFNEFKVVVEHFLKEEKS